MGWSNFCSLVANAAADVFLQSNEYHTEPTIPGRASHGFKLNGSKEFFDSFVFPPRSEPHKRPHSPANTAGNLAQTWISLFRPRAGAQPTYEPQFE